MWRNGGHQQSQHRLYIEVFISDRLGLEINSYNSITDKSILEAGEMITIFWAYLEARFRRVCTCFPSPIYVSRICGRLKLH